MNFPKLQTYCMFFYLLLINKESIFSLGISALRKNCFCSSVNSSHEFITACSKSDILEKLRDELVDFENVVGLLLSSVSLFDLI